MESLHNVEQAPSNPVIGQFYNVKFPDGSENTLVFNGERWLQVYAPKDVRFTILSLNMLSLNIEAGTCVVFEDIEQAISFAQPRVKEATMVVMEQFNNRLFVKLDGELRELSYTENESAMWVS